MESECDEALLFANRRPIGGGKVQGGPYASPFQTEIYKQQQYAKWWLQGSH